MQIETAERRRGENGGGQQQTIGDDDGDIDAICAELLLRLRIAQRRRRQHGQRKSLGDLMDGRLGRLQTSAPGGLRRTRIDGRDLVPGR